MKFWLGVTDTSWYHYLRECNPEEANFWQPGGHHQAFKVIAKGAPFLFKLKSPYNAIGGIGFFSTQAFLPLTVAWDAFGDRNGCETYSNFKKLIDIYRQKAGATYSINPTIGCLILSNPIFFNDEEFISLPENWKGSIVQGKSYDDKEPIGERLWNDIQIRLKNRNFFEGEYYGISQLQLEEGLYDSPQYRENVLSRVRIGQGAFRVMVTEAYHGRCALTGEHTLPVLEAAHIRPFSESGPHLISNGLLLRSDLHKLFDDGYITITPDLRLEVSSRLKQEFNNGIIYYKMHGRKLLVLPSPGRDAPNKSFLEWHNENVYRAG
jgi:putative restriction endonuclease